MWSYRDQNVMASQKNGWVGYTDRLNQKYELSPERLSGCFTSWLKFGWEGFFLEPFTSSQKMTTPDPKKFIIHLDGVMGSGKCARHHPFCWCSDERKKRTTMKTFLFLSVFELFYSIYF